MNSNDHNAFLRIILLLFMISASGQVSAENHLLNTKNTTMLFKSDKDTLTLHYFGAKIDNAMHVPFVGPICREYPSAYDEQSGHNGEFGYSIQQADGSISSQLSFVGARRKQLNSDQVLQIFEYKDPDYPVNVTRYYLASYESDVIETWTEIKYSGEGEVRVLQLSSYVLDTRGQNPYLTSLNGAWARESVLYESPLMIGTSEVSVTTGIRGSLRTNPSFLLSLDGPAQEDTGRVIMGSLAWNGNFAFRFKRTFDNNIQASLGYHPAFTDYLLGNGESLTTPRLILTYSQHGKGAATRSFHSWARQYGVRGGDVPRKILLNSWEGAYFNFDQDKIFGMMDRAKSMGVELFVLDDGWFGEGEFARNDDTAGLGDWQVNRAKLPDGIEGLIKHAKEVGIDFGIWVEPEMVNPKSRLYVDHPEWVLQLPNRPNRTMRSQLVLDLTNPAVQKFIYDMVDDLLSEHPGISYIKWDANSSILDPGSTWLKPNKQNNLWIDQVKGYYDVLDRLIKKHPHVTFKACASGGGRIDYGSMLRHHEFWVSDNTDALERIYMQWGLSHFYPAIAMASHVTVSSNHQTGRKTPLKFRFDVAMSGRLGFELNPKWLNKKEVEYCKKQLAYYKTVRPIVQFGDLYRLRDPQNNNDPALMYVHDQNGKQSALVFSYLINRKKADRHQPVLLKGLKPDALYMITESEDDKSYPYHGKTYSGQYLMDNGVEMRWPEKMEDYRSRVIQIKEVD